MKTKIQALSLAGLLLIIDQLLKQWAYNVLAPLQQIQIIPGVLNFTYVENRGAAFGIMQGKTVLLSIIVALVLVAGIFFLLSKRVTEKWLIWSVSLIISGGAGNLIDRLTRGFVVDFLDFGAFFNFPVFNFADCCVVVGTFLLLVFVLLLEYKEKKAREAENQKEA